MPRLEVPFLTTFYGAPFTFFSSTVLIRDSTATIGRPFPETTSQTVVKSNLVCGPPYYRIWTEVLVKSDPILPSRLALLANLYPI